MKRFNEKGDTLVEVLLALAVIGMILGVAYASASRSVKAGRFAQEQTEALKIAESQLEKIKAKSTYTPPANDVFASPGTEFCLLDDMSKHNATEAVCTTGLYTTRNIYDSATNQFLVRVDWQRLGGSASADAEPRVTLSYRLYP